MSCYVMQVRSRFDCFNLDATRYLGFDKVSSSGPKTLAGPSLLLRKRFGFDRFDHVSVSIWTPPLGDWSPACAAGMFIATAWLWVYGGNVYTTHGTRAPCYGSLDMDCRTWLELWCKKRQALSLDGLMLWFRWEWWCYGYLVYGHATRPAPRSARTANQPSYVDARRWPWPGSTPAMTILSMWSCA